METLSKVFEDKYNKNVKDCTNEEIYHGLPSWTKEQLKGRGYQEGKKKIYYISAEFLIGKLLSNNLINLVALLHCLHHIVSLLTWFPLYGCWLR